MSGKQPASGKWRSPWQAVGHLASDDDLNEQIEAGSSNSSPGRLPSTLEFVNITTPRQAGLPEYQQRVRKHAMADYWRQKKKRTSKATETSRQKVPNSNTKGPISIIKDPSRLAYMQVDATHDRGWPLQNKQSSVGTRAPDPRTLLGAGLEEAGMFPVILTPEMRQVFMYVHTSQSTQWSTFRDVWLTMARRHPSSFYMLVAASSSMLQLLRGNASPPSAALTYTSRAILSFNECLSDPDEAITDGMIGSVLLFMASANILLDIEIFKVHLSGLHRIIDLRGGIQSLQGNSTLLLMILWHEVSGATAFDISPRYPLPSAFLPPLPTFPATPPSRQLIRLTLRWQSLYPTRQSIMEIFRDIYILTSMINNDSLDVWKDPMFLGTKLNPLIHRLLQFEDSHSGDGYYLEEALRSAAILYLAHIRFEVQSIHIIGGHYVARLKSLLLGSDNGADWSKFQDLKLWICVLGTMEASGADQSYFLDLMLKSFEKLGLDSWDDALDTVRSLLWPRDMFGAQSLILGRLVNRRIFASGLGSGVY